MASKKKLKVISLGGLQEIGKNITVFEYGNDIVIVDCGIAFPDEDLLGIDLVIPDFTYLQENAERVRALFLTHGHEDHIGSVPYLLKKLNIPVIFGTPLTNGLLNNKLKEHGLKANLRTVKPGDTVAAGCFRVEFINVNHSIADACALAISTPIGNIIHTGDFKIDHTPIRGEVINLGRFAELGNQGVKLLLCESTNVESKGFTMSERSVGEIIKNIFENSKKQRLLIATFSSNIHRIEHIIKCAEAQRRKVCILGRSMVNSIKTARELGYIECSEEIFIDAKDLNMHKPEKVVIVSTGSQGEPMSALSRIAMSDHRLVEVLPNDKIVISASPIPGNEKTVTKVINELLRRGAEVIYEGVMDIHVSGHAKQEEIKIMHNLCKPEYVMPVHGEYKHLNAHKEIAIALGTKKQNVFVMNLGDVLEIDRNGARVNGSVTSGRVFVDGIGVGDVGSVVLRDRKHLSEDGLMVVVIGIDKAARVVVSGPEVISRGFVYVRESENLMEEAREVINNAIEDCDLNAIRDWNFLKNVIRDGLRDFLWKKTKRSPMILPIIMEV
ncbi:MAG: ribonuclease J [Lachnospirales bacterium]